MGFNNFNIGYSNFHIEIYFFQYEDILIYDGGYVFLPFMDYLYFHNFMAFP